MMRFRTLLLPLLAVCVISACKKSETEKTYMDGAFKLVHHMPQFVKVGAQYSFSVSGIEAPDGTDVGYCFTHPTTKKIDTTAHYTFVVPDTLGTFAVVCTAYPVQSSDLYYTSSTSVSFTVVDDEKSLSKMLLSPDAGTAVLHSRKYDTMPGGGSEWICANLSYIQRNAAGEETFGHSYKDSPAMQNILGAYYTWEEAQEACPEGWRLPSDQDWVNLIKSCGGPDTLLPLEDSPSGAGNLMTRLTFNGNNMWEYFRGVKITGSAFMGIIPAGYATISGDKYNFTGYGSYAAFWTSDELDGNGVYRYLYQEYDTVYSGLADKQSFAASVRCVR